MTEPTRPVPPVTRARGAFCVIWGKISSRTHARRRREGRRMATLVFNHEEIAARELKPELLEMDGISRAAVEAHYKLYEGYINKRNEILKKLADVDHASANQVYSDLRALKID